jgi:hypothetical protein
MNSVAQAGELAPEVLPQEAAAIGQQGRQKLGQDSLAEQLPVRGQVEESDERELLAGLVLTSI